MYYIRDQQVHAVSVTKTSLIRSDTFTLLISVTDRQSDERTDGRTDTVVVGGAVASYRPPPTGYATETVSLVNGENANKNCISITLSIRPTS